MGRKIKSSVWVWVAAAVAVLVATVFIVQSVTSSKTNSSVTSFALSGTNGNLLPSSPNCNDEWCYGTSWFGGTLNMGTVYRVKPDGTQYSVIGNFEASNGLQPSQAPAISEDGKTLYGTTSQGGSSGSGVIYTLASDGSTPISALYSFTGPNGSTPQAPPILVDNVLYGVAGQGGGNSLGVVWSAPVDQGAITVIHNFQGGAGDVATPFGALTYNPSNGMIYGMAFSEGANHLGGIFSFDPSTLDGYELVASFTDATGGVPQTGALSIGPDGNLYGNGWGGGPEGKGTVFSFNPSSNEISLVFSYTQDTGTQPYSGVVFSQSGTWMYAMTWLGGASNGGTLLAIKTDGSDSKVLVQFDASTGLNGTAAPTITTDGNRLVYPGNGGDYPMGIMYSYLIPDEYK